MYCPGCRERQAGAGRCARCGRVLVTLEQLLLEVQIEELPRLRDLARQYELGRQEAASGRGEEGGEEAAQGAAEQGGEGG